jgi:hypothetical protein
MSLSLQWASFERRATQRGADRVAGQARTADLLDLLQQKAEANARSVNGADRGGGHSHPNERQPGADSHQQAWQEEEGGSFAAQTGT